MSGRNESAVSLGTPTVPLMGVERGSGGGGSGAGDETYNGVAATERGDEPPCKRMKLLAADDVAALRKRVLEYKLLRLKNLRERFTEQLSELYFLQAGGNMMDYAAWRKRPPAPQLVAFLEARRPPPAAPPPPEPPPAPATAPAPAPADEMVEKAKQEAYVAARVAELARAGLWTERRLPRVLEPPRPKTHWDYLLEEMAWLAQDFAHERKWKKQAAKKCARAVQKYFQDKAAAAQKAEKAQELQLKKIAAFAAKEIRMFWSNVEKLVEWKRVRRVERARKEALDEQLSYIVDRTERYSRQLAANLGAPPAAPDTPPSDDEFQPRGDSDDDEETIAAAEREAADDGADHGDEIEALRRESHLDLGDLLPPGYLPAHSPPPSDYGPDDDSADDEDTIAEQERSERPEDAAAELAALKDEADLDIDELVSRYAGAAPPTTEASEPSSATDVDTDDDDEGDDDSQSSSADSSASEQLEALMDTEEKSTTEAQEKGGDADGEQRVEAAASLAATLQPTGTTLSDTVVGTPVPRLLRHALREYQHVGLHWLATMHARRLNGILADEMGLGKTIQTIALLAHLALERHDWGPHLVVAPTSVVLNWEMEFKKWCPSFKILTYYGTIKERKLKRVGWTKANSFHVCITSYKLVVQDHQSFRRKKWKYLILDEAQNIKNFKSQRWQMLLNFQTERRLLLTGTPLQNSLLELWSLMHFLMPDVFASHTEFREWFAPVAGIAEGSHRYSDALVRRLHEVLRPFLLRRLKADVERQMPRKYEHVLLCRLSKRQRFLYDDFMSRAKTKESLASGNLLSVINVLMQLRKVCNHPDLFEPRPVASPLQLPALRYRVPALAHVAAVAERAELAARLGGDLATLEAAGAGAFAAHRARHLAPPRRLVEELPDAPRAAPPRPPPAALRLHLRLVPRTPPSLRVPPAAPPAAPGAVSAPPRPAPPAPAPPAAPARGAAARLETHRRNCLRRLAAVNERRCWRLPLFGADLRAAVSAGPPVVPPRDMAALLDEMHDIIDRFVICWASCRAAAPQLESGAGGGGCAGAEGARAWRRRAAAAGAAALPLARAALALLHAPAARRAVAFPHPRLLQYDCGKLQTLDGLLRRLKTGGHRVLIFTQMTRVLDVLEAFLSMHGHTYLRLDGATRVDQRQPLVDRFNGDPRIFAFILSTRSGGVGLNLTGADSVVFYDSDWNPTMDAQAQDRCHRIGQTRDVHVYRLVTAATVEENILRKAEQKRTLGHLAIEDGHFTTSYLRAANIKELFGAEAEGASGGDAEPAEGGELESALAAAEDEADAAAAQAARAEAQGELAEFDETLPLDDERERAPAADPDAPELAALMKQLTPVEKYAMRLVENSEAATEAERAALGEMRRQLREWERARRALRDEPGAGEPGPELTYSREDARAEIWVCGNHPTEQMPIWCPPTPPSSDGDVYCESWARPLYRRGAAADALLPPVRWREARAPRSPRRARPAPRAAHAPPSLFERAGARPRPRARPPPTPAREHVAPPPDWAPCEDAALRRALRLQRLPPEPPAAHVPNWDWLADLVNETARAYRSPRACRDRHDALADPERARRKHRKPPPARRRPDDEAPRPPLQRLDAMREAAERRRAAPKRRLDDAAHHNPKHAALLAEHGVDYDAPPTPMEVAVRRAERIAKEKMKAGAGVATAAGVSQPAATAAPAPAAAPQRIVVAAHGAQAALAGAPGAGKAEAARRARVAGEAPRAAAPPAAQLLYRQQSLATRHHLKILHHASPPHSQSGSPSSSAVSEAGAALRTLQLQQLALRRAGRAPPHVVLAHLAPPTPSAPSAPSAPAAPNTPPAPHTSPAPHTPQAPDNTQQ
ncbi:helicase domino [Melitaea cinxia]|uniref:helicase domino n=1 Tax=Melitaea cinxia TaxID=113334 RepID=UPI001E26F489|nr:helicase domino [Melitaea cinxia]